MIFRRGTRFGDLIARQLDLFVRESADLIRACEEAEHRYETSERDEAEERYGEYVDLVEDGTEALAEIRDGFKWTLEEDVREDYEAAFNRAVKKRLPRFGLEIDLR
jgi:hypothetical protein